MTVSTLISAFETIGSIVGIIITLATFVGLISKKPKEALRKMIREEADNANKEIKEKLLDIEKSTRVSKENDIAMMRNSITHIYFKYKDEKKIPHYEKENVISLFDRYHNIGGNHYIETIVNEMKTWEEII